MKYLIRKGWRYAPREIMDPDIPPERRVGALGYSTAGLWIMIGLLSLGCCGFYMIQVLVNTLVPAQLKDLGACNTLIAFFATAVPYIAVVFVNPIVSYRSDRTRTRWGRRMPYVMVTIPVIAALLVVIGWSGQLGVELQRWLPDSVVGRLWLLGVAVMAYQIVFMIPGAVFWYIFPDVIPAGFLGRFMSYYQVVGAVCGMAFSYWLLPLAEKWLPWLYTGIAVFLLVTMAMMILGVREGEYPAVGSGDASPGFVAAVKNYCRECYSIPFYYTFFCTLALSEVSMVCRTMYNLIYARDALGIPLENIGLIGVWSGLIGVTLSLPLGYLCDKFNCLWVFGAGLLLVVSVNLFGFFYVCDYTSFFVISMLLAVVYTIQMVSTIPVHVKILPAPLYGQFCSANALFRAVFMVIGGLGGGCLFDWLKDYQYIFLWDFVFTLAALASFLAMYWGWRRYGGANYVAPLRS